MHISIDSTEHEMVIIRLFETKYPFRMMQNLRVEKEHYTLAMHIEKKLIGVQKEIEKAPSLLELLEAEEESDNMFMLVFFTNNEHINPWKLIKFTSAQNITKMWKAKSLTVSAGNNKAE